VFAKHAALFKELHVNANNGLGDVYDKIKVCKKKSTGMWYTSIVLLGCYNSLDAGM
jgi:monomeric isocitrate dehydrogenase